MVTPMQIIRCNNCTEIGLEALLAFLDDARIAEAELR